MKTRSFRLLGKAFIIVSVIALGVPLPARADGYLVRPGWSCRGSTPRFTAVVVQVLYQGVLGGANVYRLRYVQGQNENGSDSRTELSFDGVLESTQAPGTLGYRGENGAESATLTLRLMDQSDQSLSASFKIIRADGSVEMIPRLSCSRTRP